MEKPDSNLIKQALCWLLVILACLSARAQKLPSVQQNSLRAPANVKTDGKLSEWGNLQAYNNSTQVFYTVANDNDHLYLTARVTSLEMIKKVLVGGITFTVNKTGKKDDKENISLTYPLLKTAEVSSIGIKLTAPVFANDSITMARQTDSIARLMNEDMGNKAKEFKIKGIKQIADSLLSVYNDEGIKCVMRFDADRKLVYELALPLKYLGLAVNDATSFHYNVMLNGLDRSNVVMYPPGNSRGILMVTSVPNGLYSGGVQKGGDSMAFTFPTDFWGEYALAK